MNKLLTIKIGLAYMRYYVILKITKGKLKRLEEDKKMTLKQFINEAMDIAQQFLNKGDHENYSKCIAIIADALYEAKVEAK